MYPPDLDTLVSAPTPETSNILVVPAANNLVAFTGVLPATNVVRFSEAAAENVAAVGSGP